MRFREKIQDILTLELGIESDGLILIHDNDAKHMAYSRIANQKTLEAVGISHLNNMNIISNAENSKFE
jgi:mevalonate kinase